MQAIELFDHRLAPKNVQNWIPLAKIAWVFPLVFS